MVGDSREDGVDREAAGVASLRRWCGFVVERDVHAMNVVVVSSWWFDLDSI